MPLYDYTCEECNEVTTLLRNSEDRDKLALCESCGSYKTKRMFPKVGRPQFKGQGFYETDYARKKDG